MTEESSIASEAANEGLTTAPREELRVEETSEQYEAIAGDEGPSSIREEEPIPIEQPGMIVFYNRDGDVGNEDLNASQEEEHDERSEQPMAIALDDMDGGVRDEGPSIAQGEKASTDGSLEQSEFLPWSRR
ncbi:hypothetical protein AMTR_s00053p00119330 [Amborella trichopoda]|uniref:Uncharacterized protein n=1 Tax=Amborella trichopoda TaxID=13333 RepID=W1PDD0_AMBTC|nr:hypothetical protein AMTR_s00053p00119330 [Amborella trichopoda]